MRIFFAALWGKPLISLVSMFLLLAASTAFSETEGPLPGERPYGTEDRLTLREYMQRVVDYNESVQGRLLGFHAARRQRLAEVGTFEPAFIASGEYVDRQQPNNFQAERSLGIDPSDPDYEYPSVFEERNRRYNTSIEILSPLGTRFRVGATGGDLKNNVPRPAGGIISGGDLLGDREYETALTATIEQPLLKGLGFGTNLASLRLAARESEAAFQEYRRELMQVVAEAELAYWDLFYAQEELQLSRESVDLARTLLSDSTASFDAGRGSKLDVLEAEAGLALRLSREREAYQQSIEAMNRLSSFFGGVPKEHGAGYVAVDSPVSREVDMSFDDGIRTAMAMNPDLLRAQIKKEQEQIRIGYAKNQRLPELNLSAGFTTSGLGFDWETSFEDVKNIEFPAWTVGIVFRYPIWGDIRGRNELLAAKIRLRQAERVEGNLKTQLRVGRDTSEQRVLSNYMTARSLERVVEFRDNLLETRMQSRDIGRMDTRSVLEAEQELLAARLEQLRSEIQYQRALLELQMISGSLLKLRNLEMNFEELEYSTRRWMAGGGQSTIGLHYRVADFRSLPEGDPVEFRSDPVATPWFGNNWGAWKDEVIYTPEDDEPIETKDSKDREISRRYSGGSRR
jgi:outer membrane protein TolC